MTNKGIFRSPLFYVGDKYKLMREIKTHLPKRIRTFVEPFVGGGSVFMNVEAENYLLNDIDSWVVGINICVDTIKTKISFLMNSLLWLTTMVFHVRIGMM